MIIVKKEKIEVDLELCQLVLNCFGVYVSIKDRNKKYVYANRKLATLVGIQLDSIVGCIDRQLFDYTTFQDSDNCVLDYGDYVEDKEVVIIKSTGEQRVFLSSKQPIFNVNKLIVGVLCVSTDITEMYFQQKKLEVEATTDPLTGLFNRRFLFTLGHKYLSNSIRFNKSLSLIMLDIDLFKDINDKYGHPVGDLVIKFVASAIKGLLRKEDILARVGGEEYLVLLPYTNVKLAGVIAEKIRAYMDKQSISGDWTGEISPKLSLGVSSYEAGDVEFDQIYARADKALYQAKSSGRNKVCMFSSVITVNKGYSNTI
jgi:diguanylate cyclase (GGDEF)-like protein/PAS domain S-box-containing protein